MTDASGIACGACGGGLDPLSAGKVVAFDKHAHPFFYFCREACYQRWLDRAETADAPASVLLFAPPTPSPAPPLVESTEEGAPSPSLPLPSWRTEEKAPEEPKVPVEDPGELDELLPGVAAVAGVLAVALLLLGPSPSAVGARAVVAVVGCISLVAWMVTNPRDRADAHPIALLAAPVLGCVLAVVARVANHPAASSATTLAGIMVAASATLFVFHQRAEAEVATERRWLALALSLPGRRVSREDAQIVAAHELRSGEEIDVGPEEIVPADLVITGGQASVYPWLGTMGRVTKGEGDTLVAGSRLVQGSVRGVVTWAGNDRAWARLLFDPARRVDVWGGQSRLSRALAEQGALAAAALAALASVVNGESWVMIVATALSAAAALTTTTVARVASLHTLRGVLAAARRGVTYQTPRAWDEAARVSVCVFAARGTLLLGEPDVVEVETPNDAAETPRVLAWAAGAETGQNPTLAAAVHRAVRHRGIVPDAVRNLHALAGLGVAAVTSTGEPLLVGSRALMLERRISMALAEGRIAELEGLGRTVQIVAVAGRLAGWVAFQDGLRPGARAAVQHLLDVDVEPVLVSGEARETSEALARALDIDHVRPEVLPADQPDEVRRLTEAGAKVAVVGRSATDAAMLSAADVAITLNAAGTSPNDGAIALAGDDVRDAALALAIAHRTAGEARTALALAVAPGVVGVITVAFGFLPPLFAPLSGLVGGVVALLHTRSVMSVRREPPVTPWDLHLPHRERPEDSPRHKPSGSVPASLDPEKWSRPSR